MKVLVQGPQPDRQVTENLVTDLGHEVYKPIGLSEPDALLLLTWGTKADWFVAGYWRGKGKPVGVFGSRSSNKEVARERGVVRLEEHTLASWLKNPESV